MVSPRPVWGAVREQPKCPAVLLHARQQQKPDSPRGWLDTKQQICSPARSRGTLNTFLTPGMEAGLNQDPTAGLLFWWGLSYIPEALPLCSPNTYMV